MTLYLKYRSQRFSELDLVDVRDHLSKTLARDTWPHAWLFTGPRGVGKTSAARILAKYMNCTHRQGVEPCNGCDMCMAITAGTAPDVVEIDAASNRGIDEIRDLKARVALAPMQAKYKVYIIDEVHMLTVEAANALLKTLEEPPKNVVFILCTTEAEKLPETVVSRCTRVQFNMPTLDEIVDKLGRVAKAEGLGLKADDLVQIAEAARGSFRDGIKLLEQVGADGDVAGVLGLTSEFSAGDFVDQIILRDRRQALTMVKSLETAGTNIRTFIERCVEVVRQKLLKAAADGQETGGLIALTDRLQVAYERTKSSAVMVLPLEIFVIESTDDGSGPKVQTPGTPSKKGEQTKAAEPELASRKPQSSTDQRFKMEDLATRWLQIMKQVKPKNHSVEALLRSTRPIGFDGASLTLEVFYKFHMDKLASDKCREIVESSVAEVFGLSAPVRLILKLGDKKPVGSDGATEAKVVEELEGAVEEDIIRAAQEIFKVEAI